MPPFPASKKISTILVVTNNWTWGITWKRNCTLKHAHIDHWQPAEPPVDSSFACSSHANRGQLGKSRWIIMLAKMMENHCFFQISLSFFFAHERIKPFFVPIYPQHTMKIHETLTILASKKWHLMNPPPIVRHCQKQISVSGTWTDSAFFTWRKTLANCRNRGMDPFSGLSLPFRFPTFPTLSWTVDNLCISISYIFWEDLSSSSGLTRRTSSFYDSMGLHGPVKNEILSPKRWLVFKTNTCSFSL